MFLGFFYSKIILEIRNKLHKKKQSSGSEVSTKDNRTTTCTDDPSNWKSLFKGQIYTPNKSIRRNEDNMDSNNAADIMPEKSLTPNYNQLCDRRTSLHKLNSSVLQFHCMPPRTHTVSFFDIPKSKLEYSRLCRSQEIVFFNENKDILKWSYTNPKSFNKRDDEISWYAIPKQLIKPTSLPSIPRQMKFGKLLRLNKLLPAKFFQRNIHASNKNTFGNDR